MQTAPPHPQETARLAELQSLEILDTIGEEAYNDLVALASTICETPIALISLVDQERQWFKARVGLEAQETHRDLAFCSHAILQNELMIVDDPLQDERFADNPLVTQEPHIRFYAGIPLFSQDLPLGTLCVIDTKSRQLTSEQKVSLQRLARQAEQLLSLRKKLRQIEQAQSHKDDFISMINHELRTPLTSVFGTISLLSATPQGSFTEPTQRLLDIAKRNCIRLNDIINEILEVSAFQSGHFHHQPELVELLSCTQQSLLLIKPFAKEHDCSIHLHHTQDHAWINADPQRITQVLQNLISNAIKYSAQATDIHITHHQDQDTHRVTVTNEGPGIPFAEQPHLFERFFKSNTKHKGPHRGTGLGLYISKQIIEKSGGQIGFDSTPDEFTSFWFALPRHAPPKAA